MLRKTMSVLLAAVFIFSSLTACGKAEEAVLPVYSTEEGLLEGCEHDFGEAEVATDTCKREETFTCSKCGGQRCDIYANEGHSISVTPGTPVTCRSNGFTDAISCTVCDKTFSERKLIPLDINAHSYTTVTEAATLCSGEKQISQCKYCQTGTLISQSDTPAEYTEAGVPVVMFTGSLDGVSKENEVSMTVKYYSDSENFDAYATLKVQGNTSAEYEKKNFTLKLYEDAGHTNKHRVDLCGWGEEYKYCLKANYIDASHARNIVNARIYAKLCKGRADHAKVLDSLPNMGVIDGFPVAVYLNGEFYGMYTLNIPKDEWLYGMDEDEGVKTAILMADDWLPSAYLKEPIAKDFSNGWDLEFCSTADTSWVRDSFNEFISFVNTHSGAELAAGLSEYVDVGSFIDTILFYITIGAYDNYVKNILYVTYDGGDTWICSPYDLDSTWGLYWDGSYFVDVDKGIPMSSGSGVYFNTGVNILWPKLLAAYKSEIKARYAELRSGALSVKSMQSEFEAFFDSVPDILSESEAIRWPGIPQLKIDQQEQIFTYMEKRLAKVDEFIYNY